MIADNPLVQCQLPIDGAGSPRRLCFFCGDESRDQRLAKGDGVMKKTIATIFIVLICIIVQGCGVARNEPPPYQSKMVYDKGGSILYTMEARSLISEFIMGNEIAVHQKYMGKRVAVESSIYAIYLLPSGDPGLSLNYYTTGFSLVACQFSKVFSNDIAKMSYGQRVIVIGTVSDYTNTRHSKPTVYLKDCIFAQPVQPANPAKSQ